jgi:hypothetical protein
MASLIKAYRYGSTDLHQHKEFVLKKEGTWIVLCTSHNLRRHSTELPATIREEKSLFTCTLEDPPFSLISLEMNLSIANVCIITGYKIHFTPFRSPHFIINRLVTVEKKLTQTGHTWRHIAIWRTLRVVLDRIYYTSTIHMTDTFITLIIQYI